MGWRVLRGQSLRRALLPYAIRIFIFTCLPRIPPFINTIRCAVAYKSAHSSFAATLATQGIWTGAMTFLLANSGLGSMTLFFVALATVRSLSTPRDQLMQERYDITLKRANRDARYNKSIRSAPEGRAEAPNFWREMPLAYTRAKEMLVLWEQPIRA